MDSLAAMRKQTKRYIDENPITTDLSRVNKVPDSSGGVKTTRAPINKPQTFRIIQQQQNQQVERRAADGTNVRPDLNLMAEYDADVKKGDQFTYQGATVEVVYIQDLNYELMCEVAQRS